jgi:hypothetical protein
MDVYNLFRYSAARREDYEHFQNELGCAVHKFQQHTEVRWLSLGPAIVRLLEQWQLICEFVTILGKDEKTAPRSVNYRRAAAMLMGPEKIVTKAKLEFLANIVPVFEDFLEVFQKTEPQVHVIYDHMTETLFKLFELSHQN